MTNEVITRTCKETFLSVDELEEHIEATIHLLSNERKQALAENPFAAVAQINDLIAHLIEADIAIQQYKDAEPADSSYFSTRDAIILAAKENPHEE